MVLCAVAMASTSSSISKLSFNALEAEKLSTMPEQYFVVTNADSLLTKAISDLGKPVYFHLLDDTQIDDLISQYGTNNVEYQNNYYRLGILFVDPSPNLLYQFYASFFGFTISTILLISYGSFKVSNYFRKRQLNSSKQTLINFSKQLVKKL